MMIAPRPLASYFFHAPAASCVQQLCTNAVTAASFSMPYLSALGVCVRPVPRVCLLLGPELLLLQPIVEEQRLGPALPDLFGRQRTSFRRRDLAAQFLR